MSVSFIAELSPVYCCLVHTLFSLQIETIKFTIKNTNAVIDKSETDQNCIKMELT